MSASQRQNFAWDVIVERHVSTLPGVEPPQAAPEPWSVWVGRVLMLRTQSHDAACDEAERLSTVLKRPLWLNEDGERYQLVAGVSVPSPRRRC
jgi:hypothetical protein